MNDTDVNAVCPPTTAGDNPSISPAASAPNIVELRSAILKSVISHTEQASLPAKWSFLKRSDAMRQLQLFSVEVGKLLQDEFSVDDLLATGILVRSGPVLQLSPKFGDAGSKFFVQFDLDERPVGIHGAHGALFHARPAGMQWGMACNEGDSEKQIQPLLLCETLDDMQVLRALKFEAVVSSGIDTFNVAEFNELLPANVNDDRCFKFRLIIADWNVSTITDERRPRAGRIIKRLADAQRLYDVDPGRRFNVWRPDGGMRLDFRAAASFGDAKVIRQQLLKSLPQPAIGLNWRYQCASRELNFAAARDRLQRTISLSTGAPRVADVSTALEQYLEVIDRLVTRRLYSAVDVAISPLDGLSNMAAAELAEHWINGSGLVRAAKAILSGTHPGNYLSLDSDRLDERLRISNHLHKLLRNTLPRK